MASDVAFVRRALDSWLASTSDSGSSQDSTGAVFQPSDSQQKEACHLAHRLELARITAGGVDERLVELRARLEATNREVQRAETDVQLANRRLRFAKCNQSKLAELAMGDDAGAFPSVFDARGDLLARNIREASRDSTRYEQAVLALEKRKTLVTDELLKHTGAGR
ncbi:hypothetical protein OAD67_01055 [bacterium]|jgi:hypothetical protein|nr:hypothetical protein [bacterium]|tara:strand:- start:4342 stop:4839 length:498 start_codon:yes stop_codon:yes gene_type:complete